MISHREIMIRLAEAIQVSDEVAAYCREHFGRGLAINVGAYPSGIPGEDDSPFLWIQPKEENEEVAVDQTFTVRLVVAGLVKGPNGEKVIADIRAERTETSNGLTVNGGNKVVEDLRDLILAKVRAAKCGAILQRIRREENDISHFPLEWATMFVEFTEPESL